jgi:uncharacterized protein involved in response to NO
MVPVIAGALAGLMMLFVALRGLRRGARLTERVYTGAFAVWSVLGAAIYRPVLLGRFAPHALVANHAVVTIFGFGLLVLGVYGATLLAGGHDG